MRKLRIGDVLIKSRDSMSIDDATEYRQVTVRMKHQGVCLRGYKLGKEIGTKQQSFVKKGQFILSKIDARNGAFGIIPDDLEGAIITNDFLTYDVNEKELNIQLFRLLTSQPTFDDICNKASTGTTNRKRLSEREFLAQEITVPPIEEQDSFINHFKKIQALQENTKIELAIQSDLLVKLRSSILSDAVSGRLVSQDPTDESASVLLERIKTEKERLIQEGKLKRDKPLTPITADKIPYELPDGWVWCRLGEISITSTGGTPSRGNPVFWNNGTIPWLKSGELNDNLSISFSGELITEEALRKSSAKIFLRGTLLLALYGATAGKLGILNIDSSTNQAVCGFQRINILDTLYLFYYLRSIREKIISECFGGAQPNISQSYVKELLFPLPPLVEQHRIVIKIEQLMTTCDAIEEEVAKSRMETDRLMQTILKEAFDVSENE